MIDPRTGSELAALLDEKFILKVVGVVAAVSSAIVGLLVWWVMS